VSHIDQNVLNELLAECDKVADARYEAGQRKYGPNKYLDIDTLQHAVDEVVDLLNYARFTYVKLRLLQQGLANKIQADGSVAEPIGPEMPGKPTPLEPTGLIPTGFITVSEPGDERRHINTETEAPGCGLH
jgi:hypothetical protein